MNEKTRTKIMEALSIILIALGVYIAEFDNVSGKTFMGIFVIGLAVICYVTSSERIKGGSG